VKRTDADRQHQERHPERNGGPEMAATEADGFVQAWNHPGRDGESPAEEEMSRVGLLKQRLGAVRVELIHWKARVEKGKADLAAMQAELEEMKAELGRKQENLDEVCVAKAGVEKRVDTLDHLLKEVYASRTYRLVNWLHGRVSALRALISMHRRSLRQGSEKEGKCVNGLSNAQGGDDEAGQHGPAVLHG
jgi:hypothetical protein